MANVDLNGDPVLTLSLHLPLNGAWSAELQVASDVGLAPGDSATLDLPGLSLIGTVVRAGQFGERLRARLTGGTLDWSAHQEVKHYRETTADRVLADVGVEPETDIGASLPYWTRSPGTVGSTVQAVARHLGYNWRVQPDGSIRIAEETPTLAADPDAQEISRDPARGLVTVAPEQATILPGTTFGEDSVGDVIYDLDDTFRCRYYTEARGRLRGAFDRLVRYLTRDALFLGQYAAEVVSQAADGSLDLLPDDPRLRAQGLQSVPIRHGLPGVEVDVPSGERVLLGFDGGNPSQPYAALWHEGSVSAVRIGGSDAVAMAAKVQLQLDTIQSAYDAHTHVAPSGVTAVPVPLLVSLGPVESQKLFTE